MKQLRLVLAVILFTQLSAATFAATRTFTGGSGNWSDPLNWTGFTPPVDGDTVIFNAAWGNTTNDLAGVRIYNLTVAPGNDIYGNAIHVSALTFSGPPSANSNIRADVTLNAEVTLTMSYASDAARISGDLRLNGHTLTVQNSAAGNLFLNGVIMGTGDLIKDGSTVLEIGGDTDNTFVGTTTVRAGTLRLNKVNAGVGQIAIPGDLMIGDGHTPATVELDRSRQIENSATVTVRDHGVLDLNGNNDIIGTLVLLEAAVASASGTLTIQSNLICPRIIDGLNLPKSNSLACNLAFDAANAHIIEVSTNTTLAIFGDVSGGGNISRTGPTTGSLYLLGTNTFTGTFTNTIGSLFVGAYGLGDTNAPTVITDGSLILEADVIGEPLIIGASGDVFTSFVNFGNYKLTGDVITSGAPNLNAWSSSQLTLSGNLSGAGVTINDGAIIFSGVNSHTGVTTIKSAATLFVNGTQTNSPIAVLTGGFLGGSGTVGIITNAGTLFPGNYNSTTGAVFTAGNVVSTAGKISFDSGTLGANNHDRLIVASLTLANTALEIYDRTNSSLTPGTSLTYVTKNTAGPITTPFTAVAENAGLSLSNHVFLATYTGGSGNDFALTPFVHSIVPATGSQLIPLGGGGFQFGASGSNGVLYALVTATNLTLPATNWTTLTNVFPSAGLIRVKLTNSVAKPQQFFRLKTL